MQNFTNIYFRKVNSVQCDENEFLTKIKKGLEWEWINQNANILGKTELHNCIQKPFPQSLLGTFSSLHNVIKFKPDEFTFIPKTDVIGNTIPCEEKAEEVACLGAKRELENCI